MLNQVAEGVFVHTSVFLQSNCVVVQGRDGVLLVDPGITGEELADLAHDIRELGQPVVAGFATHPHWDHLLWHANFGDVPRYATAPCAAAIHQLLSNPGWASRVAGVLPAEYANDIPMDRFGQLTGLPAEATQVPWNGPNVRIIQHRAHATGHAALLIDDRRVLVAGDMLSDALIPFLDVTAANPINDYLAALGMFDGVADEVDVVIPGHGSVGDGAQFRARIDQDRAYVEALRDQRAPDDARIGPSAPLPWLSGVHESQAERMSQRQQGDG